VILEDQDLASDKHKNAAKAAKKFQGLKCNQPVKTPNDRKKYKVRACQDGEEKLVRFGESGHATTIGSILLHCENRAYE
jgi:hypothetical protein